MIVEFFADGYNSPELHISVDRFHKALKDQNETESLIFAIRSFYLALDESSPFDYEGLNEIDKKIGKSGVLIFYAVSAHYRNKAQLDISISNHRENLVYYDERNNNYWKNNWFSN